MISAVVFLLPRNAGDNTFKRRSPFGPVLMNFIQDGRLAPAYFSPNYKYFDQLLQTVKKTTVLILIFEEFLQTSIV